MGESVREDSVKRILLGSDESKPLVNRSSQTTSTNITMNGQKREEVNDIKYPRSTQSTQV